MGDMTGSAPESARWGVVSAVRRWALFAHPKSVVVLVLGVIQTLITFDGSLSSWWTKIVIGMLLFAFILLQRLVVRRKQ